MSDRQRRAWLLFAVLVAMGMVAVTVPAQGTTPAAYGASVIQSASRVSAYEWRRIDVTPLSELKTGFARFAEMGGTTISLDVTRVVDIAAMRNATTRTRALADWKSALDQYIAAAAAAGLEVEALAGSPTWIRPKQRNATMVVMDFVSGFNAARSGSGRLVGLQFDIEPWVDVNWADKPAYLTTQWLDTIAGITAKQLTTAAGLRVPLTMTVPFWLDGTAAPTKLTRGGVVLSPTEHIVRMLDNGAGMTNAVAVMAYRDLVAGPNGSLALSATEIAFTEKTAGRVLAVIAQEVTDVEPAYITFWQEGRGALTDAMSELAAHNAGKVSFGGFAINDFRALTTLS